MANNEKDEMIGCGILAICLAVAFAIVVFTLKHI
jgi:hypothetical protein